MLLVGDIGGTKTDLAVVSPDHGPRAPLARNRFPSGDYRSLADIAREFLADVNLPVNQAIFAVAGPVVNGRSALTNLPWTVEESALQAALGLEFVRLLNDVQAMAAAVPDLQPDELLTIQPGDPSAGGAIAVIAAGTGLGEAFLTWDGSRYHAHASEGSHDDFGGNTPLEAELLAYLQKRYGRVSYERVCAGRSIPDLYDFLKDTGHVAESAMLSGELATMADRTPRIVAAALDPRGPDPLSLRAVNLCVSTLGAEAGNLALTVLATSGLYVAGGIAQRILPFASEASQILLSSFNAKGRLSPLLARVPVHIILEPVALLGAACLGFENIPQPARSVTA